MTGTEWLQVLAAFAGSLGFALLFNVRGRKIVAAAVGGLLSWLLFILLGRVIADEPVRYFIVAFAASLYAELMARLLKTPITAFVTISLIPLIPGSSLYYTMTSVFDGNWEVFLQKALYTIQLASALALGIIVVTTLVRALSGMVRGRRSQQ